MLSADLLASRSGIDKANLSRLLNGQPASLRTVMRLAIAMRSNLEDGTELASYAGYDLRYSPEAKYAAYRNILSHMNDLSWFDTKEGTKALKTVDLSFYADESACPLLNVTSYE